jgi:hypothetical protein
MDMRVGEVGSGDVGYVRGDEDEKNESLIFMNVCDVGVVWFEMQKKRMSRVQASDGTRVERVYKSLVFVAVSLSSLSHLLFVSYIQKEKSIRYMRWTACGEISKNVRL